MKKYIISGQPEIGDVKHGYSIGYSNYNLYAYMPCKICKEPRWVQITRGKPISEHCQQCCQKNRVRAKRSFSPNSFKDANGYIRVKLNKDTDVPYYLMASSKTGYVLQHRLVMAKHLGRCLEDWEIVSHLNGMRADNRIENLVLLGGSNEYKTKLEQRLMDLENKCKAQEERIQVLENTEKPLDS